MSATTTVRERPILFSGAMVRAILGDAKTQTRRVVKDVPRTEDDDLVRLECGLYHPTVVRFGMEEPGDEVFGAWTPDGEWATRCPYGQPGDRLWVREACIISPKRFDGERSDSYTVFDRDGDGRICQYIACAPDTDAARDYGLKVTPSIHMPRWASRLTLEITEVRVERLQAITAEGCIAEGVPSRGIEPPCIASAIMYLHDFETLWNGINASRGYGWDVNPWVWVIEFRRLPA